MSYLFFRCSQEVNHHFTKQAKIVEAVEQENSEVSIEFCVNHNYTNFCQTAAYG